MCPRPFGRERLRPAGLIMPRARPCGRARLCSAPTTPYAARETFQARATRARATPDHGAVHGAQRPRQTCAMRRSSSRARIRATQCESERSTAGAMGGGSADEPLPAAIQDAVAAAIEDGATMDEIVERVRSRGGDRSPLIPRARRCARARPAEGRWAERMDGLICLQRETDRFAEEWVRTREPGAEGRSALIAIETLRTLALSTMADLSQRTEPVATEDLARLALALHRIESADRLRIEREQAMADAAAARRAGRARGQYDACRTGRNRPPGSSRGTSSLGAQSRRRRHRGGPPPLPRTLPSPCRTPDRRRPLPRIHESPRRPAPGPAPGRCVGRARGAGCVGRALGAGCRAETAGGGRRLWPTDPPFCPSAWSGPG